jgi:hypothetical protein
VERARELLLAQRAAVRAKAANELSLVAHEAAVRRRTAQHRFREEEARSVERDQSLRRAARDAAALDRNVSAVMEQQRSALELELLVHDRIGQQWCSEHYSSPSTAFLCASTHAAASSSHDPSLRISSGCVIADHVRSDPRLLQRIST